MSSRSPLDAERVRRAVGTAWSRVDVVDETTSTNADLAASASRRADREVLVAERQTSGRGRLDRVWTSPPGAGLLFSMLLRPRAPMAQWGWLPLLAGVALAEGVERVAGIACALKWPNDLLVGAQQRKAAGILVQTAGDAVVIGIGLNVSTTADELPVPTATSLAVEGAPGLGREALLAAVLSQVDARLTAWDDASGDPTRSGLADAYRPRCATLGHQVRVTLTGGPPLVGEAVDLDGSGRLVLDVRGRT
ncbi:biotin--[acetyl-CoA-carboxylase] ligase, partial [Jatrophihabitans endophyticus]|uniref:biotin--[acetyl-CoA-carboxylase] ligase n=1 Tax=Jatrophihabitans endophyticus TaxID=1206085 RepID=UPI0019E119E4